MIEREEREEERETNGLGTRDSYFRAVIVERMCVTAC